METYKKDLKSFCLVKEAEEADLRVADLPPENRAKYNLRYLCPVEWKTEFIDHTLQYLTEVWEVFSCRYLGPKSPPTALLDHVRKGCFSITWLVPSYLIPALTKKAKTDTDFFQQQCILKLTVADQCVYERAFHQFYCCNHPWEERVPDHNPQSECQKCGKIQEAILMGEEFGVCKFICPECRNHYTVKCRMCDTAKCYKCGK